MKFNPVLNSDEDVQTFVEELLRARRFAMNGEAPEEFADKILQTYHLPGEHDQADHGNRGGGLAEKALKEGGFTYNPVRIKNRAAPAKGYALSLRKDTERVIDIKAGREAVKKEIIEYVRKHREAIKERGNFVGGWYDEQSKKIFLDVSTVVADRDQAVNLAEKHEQLAIYDLGEGKVIDVLRRKAA